MNARDLPCPTCNAQPGQPCTVPTDTSRRPVSFLHLSREDAANEPGN